MFNTKIGFPKRFAFLSPSADFLFDFTIDCFGNIEEIYSDKDDNEETCEDILKFLINNDKINFGKDKTKGVVEINNNIIKLKLFPVCFFYLGWHD